MFWEDKNMEIVFDKKCPLCGNNKMIKKDSSGLHSSTTQPYSCIQLGAFATAYATRYVCYECGYQMDIYENNELEKLRKKANK